MNSGVAARSVPAPRKDLQKVRKRKSSTRPSQPLKPMESGTEQHRPSTKPFTMSLEDLIATLNDDNAQPSPPPLPIVNYYTYEPPPPPPPPQVPQTAELNKEPRLLVRQAYKLTFDTSVVIGVECVKDYNPSIYLVNRHLSVVIPIEDLFWLRSITIITAIDRYFSENLHFEPICNKTVCIEALLNQKTVRIVNRTCWTEMSNEPHEGLHLNVGGWTALKKHYDCIESYYNVCSELSLTTHYLTYRYARYLASHYYKSEDSSLESDTSPLDPAVVNFVSADLPNFLRELSVRRLPAEEQPQWYQTTPLREALTPWLDSEVRRYCVPNIVEEVLEHLKYYNHMSW